VCVCVCVLIVFGDAWFGCVAIAQNIRLRRDDPTSDTVVPIPSFVAIVSDVPPPSLIGIKSVMRDEAIVPMSSLKMGWIPYLPRSVSRYRVTHELMAYVNRQIVIDSCLCLCVCVGLSASTVRRRNSFSWVAHDDVLFFRTWENPM
jgi:hypothetical protein